MNKANPAHSTLNLNLPQIDKDQRFAIYDTKGRLIQEIHIEADVQYQQIDVSALHLGIYYIKSVNTGAVVKFVKTSK